MCFCACTTYRLKVPFKDLLLLSAGLTAISASLICEPLQGRLQAQTLIIISSDINQNPCLQHTNRGWLLLRLFFLSATSSAAVFVSLKVLPVRNCRAKLTQTKNVSTSIAHYYKLIFNLLFCQMLWCVNCRLPSLRRCFTSFLSTPATCKR